MIEVSPGLVEYLGSSSGAAHVELRTNDADAAANAMESARRALFRVPHPEEPDDPLPSFVSDVTTNDRGATFWFDAADAEAYDGLLDRVVEVLRESLEASGIDGTLTWPDAP